MSAMCTGRAVRRARTRRAPTPAAVWRATCCSQTTALVKPKMVRTHTLTHTHTHANTHTSRMQFIPNPEKIRDDLFLCHKWLPAVLYQIIISAWCDNPICFLQACLLERDVLQVSSKYVIYDSSPPPPYIFSALFLPRFPPSSPLHRPDHCPQCQWIVCLCC